MTWLNFLCLDAPLVAIAWQWLFARCLHVELANGSRLGLFLTAWLIYLIDRLVDTTLLAQGTPKSARDVWNNRDLASVNAPVSVPAHDLVLIIIDGEDEPPAEYTANQTSIAGMQITGIQVIPRPEFARLHYANTTGHVVVLRMKSTSGLSTAIALPPTAGSETGTVGLILPKGPADFSFEGQGARISRMEVYPW